MEVVRLTCMGVMLWLGCGTASFSIEDIVLHKESGKDGYTAIIQTKGGKEVLSGHE